MSGILNPDDFRSLPFEDQLRAAFRGSAKGQKEEREKLRKERRSAAVGGPFSSVAGNSTGFSLSQQKPSLGGGNVFSKKLKLGGAG